MLGRRSISITIILGPLSWVGSWFQRPGCLLQRAVVALMAIGLAAHYPAAALEYQLVFDESQSEFPDFDPDGSRLKSIMEEAAARWEEVTVTPGTMRIDFSYAPIESADAQVNELQSFDSRTSRGRIRFSSTRDWWFDPTPSTDTEFKLIQALYLDLLPAQQSSDFSGSSPQPLLEIGLRGFSSIPEVLEKHDVLSSALHEIGHLMGITDQFAIARSETADGDYDFEPLRIGGADMGVVVHSDGTEHFANSLPLMSGVAAQKGSRRLPSVVDYLAANAVSGWDFDLPRVDFVGPNNGDFHNHLDWIGGRVPNGDNDAYVRHGGVLQLSQNATTRDLIVDFDSSIVTNGNTLRTFGNALVGLEIEGVISVQNFTGSGGVPELDTQDLTIGRRGTVHVVNQNSLVDVRGDLVIDQGGQLLGNGTVEVAGALNNNGTITGGSFLGFGTGGTLTLNVSPIGGRIDLDGSSDAGKVNALDGGSVILNGQILDTFDGEMRIGPGKFVGFNSPFQLGTGGKVELLGGSESAALVSFEEMLLGGNVVVDKNAAIVAPVQTNGDTVVELPDVEDRLDLTELTRLGGGTFVGQGVLRQLGDLHVFGETTINTAVYDWDGINQSKTTITSDGVLTINSQSFAADGDTGHDGLIVVRGGALNVNKPGGWRLENLMNLHAGSTVGGTEIDVAPGALIRTVQLFPLQNTEISAPLRISSGAVVDARDEKLLLGGRTTFDGGLLTGLQTVTQAGDVVVESDSSVDLDVYEWDGGRQGHSTSIKSGATWTLQARKIANSVFPFGDGYDGTIDIEDGGTLNVDLTDDSSWRLDGTLSIAGAAAVTGDDVENRGRIDGIGSIHTNVNNLGVVAPGNSIGRLIVGGYQQSANGTLEIELAGLAPETEYDVIEAISASIDGTLTVELEEGFLPPPGTRFDFLRTFQSLTGDFSDLRLIAPPGILFDGVVVSPSPTVRSFEVNYAVRATDYDMDGDVDRDDLFTWQANFGVPSNTGHASGDSNGDGAIDGKDFLTWQRQYDSGNISVAGRATTQAVPEPNGLLMLLVLGATKARWRVRFLHAEA